ncbi:MAG: hypothetical protein KF709_10495 [Gemmatimonadaceae bacterium]|nr:hypothetical protein [Gemmatimonadaceae bacterium]
MRHATPRAALETLEREMIAIGDDVSTPGAMLEQRLGSVLELLPVIGIAARDPQYHAERGAVITLLLEMSAKAEGLQERMRQRMGELSREMGQLRNQREAAFGYARPPRTRMAQLDMVG